MRDGDTGARADAARASMYGLAMTLVTALGIGPPGYADLPEFPLEVALGLGVVTFLAVFLVYRANWDAVTASRR